MLNFDVWLGTTPGIIGTPTDNEATRAAAAWRRIQDKPSSVAFIRPAVVTPTGTTPETTLTSQDVRIEQDNTATPTESPTGIAARRKVIVFGVRNHATIADTDMKQGYRFRYEDENYRVNDIILQLGEIQGVCEAIA